MNWPYIVFTNFENHLFVINSFNRHILYRIETSDHYSDSTTTKKQTIAETYITNTKDLFIVINVDDMYFLHQIDLD